MLHRTRPLENIGKALWNPSYQSGIDLVGYELAMLSRLDFTFRGHPLPVKFTQLCHNLGCDSPERKLDCSERVA